ncbi:uncharacterized protein BO80DRAFT_186691 [Aspergillus ibericus CBS 121593]|uniref:Uncharacterized protein n=1 Tax=Aspergillus ibericus CBS 121593 TaxID=1448316 RepID=A0A395GRJ1_9EURO|nr:hypothetical protein BO80DRAFT_186691 [Aspergillus ibericus CBS 121593]RAK97588.1 hypothetical protein BO80DRAFT_186691 [Aspergillus ibericus CBS 121593]
MYPEAPTIPEFPTFPCISNLLVLLSYPGQDFMWRFCLSVAAAPLRGPPSPPVAFFLFFLQLFCVPGQYLSLAAGLHFWCNSICVCFVVCISS